jgi:hypothetical protein
MSLRRYVASGKGRPFAIVWVLAVSLIGGVGVGVIEGMVDRWISLLLLFPALIGAAAGGLGAVMVRRHQLRAPAIVLVLGIAGGVAGYAAIHVVDYVRFRTAFAASIQADHPSETGAGAAAAIDQALIDRTGKAGFFGFLDLAAQQGVTIKRVGVGDPGLALTGVGAWVVWLFELLLAAAVAGLIARRQAREPFCESCQAWYGPPSFIASGGDASRAARKRFIDALDHGDVDTAAAAFRGPRGRRANFALTSSTCPGCGADLYCSLKRVAARKTNHAPSLESWFMTKDELARLGQSIARPRPQ